MRGILFWAALPFILPQAWQVRRTAPRFSDAAGPSEGQAGTGSSNVRLLALGDSIIAGVGASTLERALVGQSALALSERLQSRVHWQARGRTGITSEGALNHQVVTPSPESVDYIIVSLGVNDVTGLHRAGAYRRSMTAVVSGLQRSHPEAVIALSGLPPLGHFPLLPQPMRALFGMRARQFDDVVHDLAASRSGVVHVPIRFAATPEQFADDGFHPSETGYREYGQAVAAALLMAD